MIHSRKYLPDATLLLIGFFGAGKKTLGIIASVALHRRFIDFEAFFREKTGLSPQAYIAAHGLAQYRTVEEDLTRELLTKCRNGCVIVGLGALASNQQQILLKDFAQDHPVVYVRRAESELRRYMGTSQDKFERFWQAGNTFFETCSNFEFYNQTHTDSREFERQLPSSLSSKRPNGCSSSSFGAFTDCRTGLHSHRRCLLRCTPSLCRYHWIGWIHTRTPKYWILERMP